MIGIFIKVLATIYHIFIFLVSINIFIKKIITITNKDILYA